MNSLNRIRSLQRFGTTVASLRRTTPPSRVVVPTRLFSSRPPMDERGSVAVPELIKFGIVLIPALVYLAYTLQFGPSEEEIEAKIQQRYGKEIELEQEVSDYEKNIIAQAVFAPQRLEKTVDGFLKGGRYGAETRNLSSAEHRELEQELEQRQRADAKLKQEEEDDEDEATPQKKSKKKN